MNKNFFDVDNNILHADESGISPIYSHKKTRYGDADLENIKLESNNICILPFEVDGSGNNIKNLFLIKYHDFFKNTTKNTALVVKKEDADISNLDTVYRALMKYMSIPTSNMPLERSFYLGEIELNVFVSGTIPCYGVNVTGLITDKENSFVINEKLLQKLERVNYVSVLKGATHDYLVSSSTFMLLSYLS